jgi:hypothetical protein
MRHVFAAFGLLCFMLAAAGPMRAQEIFTGYHSAIDLAADGKLTVTETITANVEGDRIRRGIYRDIPLTFIEPGGHSARVDFKLLSVERDGAEEPHRTESIDGGIRIYTGDAEVLLPHGEHVFRFTYETDRQIRFFPDHDELYWNVTGTQWAFPIEQASATVSLPPGVKVEALDIFTGRHGETGKEARAVERGDEIVFTTTRVLQPGEGLTIAVKMAKGAIAPPTARQQNLWWLQDRLAPILAILGLVVVALYYTRLWMKVGRDPARGVMVPRWDAPEGISPALVNYIDNRGFSGQGWTALSAAALNLAVRGHVVLEDLKDALVITTTKTAFSEKLPAGEAALLKAVVAREGRLVIDKANGPAVQKTGADFRAAMEREHRGKYYRANTGYIVGGLVLSVLFLLAIFLFGGLDEQGIGLVVVPVVASVFISVFAVGFGKTVRRKASLAARIFSIVVIAFFGFIAVSAFSGVFAFMIFEAVSARQLPLLIGVGGILLVNLLFFFLMGAPTPLGARMMDGIDGLRQYLTLAEKDRMNMAGAPQMSPRHFETLLPYAVALGVEKPWSETFDRWLLAAAAGAAAYQPAWYHGDNFTAGSFGDRMGGFAGSLADTMTASLPPPPKSSSSGFSSGGGFSGGGGGGGGGGGW